MSAVSDGAAELGISTQMADLIFLCLDHGLPSLEGADHLIPFVISEQQGSRKIQRFAASMLESALQQARTEAQRRIRKRAEMVVLAYEGYCRVDGARYDAVMVEGFGSNVPNAVVFAQRYQRRSERDKLRPIGNPAFLGRTE